MKAGVTLCAYLTTLKLRVLCDEESKKAIWIYQIAHFDLLCGRWDLNPHANNMHKILSLARLPVPTLPRIGLPPTVDIICMNPSFVNKKLYLFF